jgi:hypothetical protein
MSLPSDSTIYLPSIARSATLGVDFHTIYLQTSLQEPLRSEAIIDFALAIQSPQFPRDNRMPKALLFHSNKATATLRQRLLSGVDAISDEVVHTISILYGVTVGTSVLRGRTLLSYQAQHRQFQGL